MAQPTSPFLRTGQPAFTEFNAAAACVIAPSSNVGQPMTIQDLRDSNVPPIDHAYYTLPAKSVQEQNNFAASNGTVVGLDSKAEARMVNKETVQDFLNDGICPANKSDRKALAYFLLTSKLFNALAWLVFRNNGNMLDLRDFELGNDGADSVAKWAVTIPFKVSLDLSHNGIDANGAAFIAHALATDTISCLTLDGNPLGDEGVQSLCGGLLRNSSLQLLGLAWVGAGGAAMQAFAGVLDSHPSLTEVNLNASAFDDEAAAVFSAALGRNKKITGLDMCHVQASDTGLSVLAGLLKTNTALKRISLGRSSPNNLPLALADTLAEALGVNRALTHLHLSAAIVPAAAGNRLVAAVATNTTLLSFRSLFSFFPAVFVAQKKIEDKLKANFLIEAAGNALADLSRRPEWPVAVPDKVGQSIAGLVAQVALDATRSAAMKSVIEAGPLARH